METEFIPLIILFGFVVPLWIVFHYITVWKKTKSISAEDENYLRNLKHSADKLEKRLIVMERILDEEVPGWRTKLHDPL